jgi:hypothetical protein
VRHAAFIVLTFIVSAFGAHGATVWTASTDRLEGEVRAITADGRLEFVRGGKTTSLLLRDLHRIRFREMPKAPAFDVEVRVTDGSMLRGKLVRPKHALGIRLPAAAQAVDLKAGNLLGVRFVPAKGPAMPSDRFEQELAKPNRNADTLFVISPKGIVPLDVAVSKIAPDKVSFTWDRKDRSIDTARVAAVIFANQPQETQPPATARLTDASVLRGRVLSLKNGLLTFELAGVRLPVPAAGIVAIDFVNPNVTYLSDLKPAAVRETPFFNHIWGHRLDRSVGGKELTLDGRRYARGIGCHTRTELTYGLDGAYRTFAAVIGIDDEARPRGSVRFVVQADGKTIHAVTLTGNDKATPIALNVAGVKTLTLLADFADGANVGDHADWADARVVK